VPANFLIAVREDAYGGLGDLFSGRISNVYNNYLHLEYLAREAAREAIEKPVEVYNADHPELFAQLPSYLSSNFDCFMYAQDNVDEFAPVTNNPSVDNDLLIYVGAVCAQRNQGGSTLQNQVIAELTAPLLYSPTANIYTAQASGGSQGNNNDSVMNSYR